MMGAPDGMEDLAMSEPFDVLMQDPSDADLVAAFEEASLSKVPASFSGKRWTTQLAEVADNAEGQMAITHMTGPRDRTTYLLLVWWSDHLGGKHVRVRGGDKVNLRTYLSRLDHDERPPLWQVYPERVYRVKRGDAEPVWLASCACGVTGPPRALAWMGPRCGPCHDRREEGDLGAVSEGRTILREGGAVNVLAFAPDDTGIAAVIQKMVLVHIRFTGEELLRYGDEQDDLRPGTSVAPVTFSPDGRWLAFGDSDAGQIVLLDANAPFTSDTDPTTCLSMADDQIREIIDIAFSPASDHLAACDYSRQGILFRWTGSLWAEVKSFKGATAVAISNDGQRLAIGGSGGIVRLYSTDSGAKLGQVTTGGLSHEFVSFLAWTPGDEALILLTGAEDEATLEQQQLRRWSIPRQRQTHCADFGIPSLLAMSPDGRYLASIYHDEHNSPSAIYFWDLVAWHEVGRIEWDPEDMVLSLAFSPDDETLAIGTHHGRIKVVPWRFLLVG